MATVLREFSPGSAVFPATGSASPDVLTGTNFPVPVLRFAKGEAVFFPFEATDYGSGNLSIELLWSADTGDTGDVVLSAAIGAVTPETDTAAITAETLDTPSTVTDAHLGTTARRLHRATITLTNLDGVTAGDWCVLQIARDDDVADDLSGDAFLHQVIVTYSNA